MSERMISFSRDASYSDLIAEKFTQLRNNADLVDFCIKVENKTFNCHKMLIASHSPVLFRMMMSKMKEGKENSVSLNHLSAPAIESILDYFYTGNFSCPSSLLHEVVTACHYLQVNHLLEFCRKEVASILSPLNVIAWLNLASLLELTDLTKKCIEIFCASFSEVAQQDEFLSLTPAKVKDCITEATRRNIASDDLARAVLCWIRADIKERATHCKDIMQGIKLEKCSPEFLRSAIEEFSEVLQADHSFFILYTSCMAGKGKAAVSNNLSLILIGGDGNKKAWKLSKDKHFQEVTRIPDDVFADHHSICLYDNIGIVVTGGTGKETCTMFLLDEQRWKPLKKMRTTRCHHASICVNGVLIVLGGIIPGDWWSGNVARLSLKSEDEEEDWQAGPNLPKSVRWHKAAKHLTDIFVVSNTRELFHLDTTKSLWQQKAQCPGDIGNSFSVAAGDGKILVAGGLNKVCHVYTINQDTWITGNNPHLSHMDGGLAWINHSFLLLGGGDTDVVEEYDIESDTWKEAEFKCPVKNVRFHVFAIDIQE